MPLTDHQLVRQRITDPPRYYDSAHYGDGIATRYTLPVSNLVSASAFVQPGGTAWSASAATFNPTGFVDFANPISAQSAFRIVGVYTVFSDEVIDERVSAYGVRGAALECCYDLLFDAAKRARWGAPDGSQYDDTGSITALNMAISALKHEEEEAAIQGGGFWSWAETQ